MFLILKKLERASLKLNLSNKKVEYIVMESFNQRIKIFINL